jgi:hypothetical protein
MYFYFGNTSQWRRARYGLIWPAPYLSSQKNHTVSLLFALFSTVEYHAGHTLDLLRPPPLIISFAENLDFAHYGSPK